MYIHVADRRVSANPSGKREMEIDRGKEQRQGGGDEWCVRREQGHLARNPREGKNQVQCLSKK